MKRGDLDAKCVPLFKSLWHILKNDSLQFVPHEPSLPYMPLQEMLLLCEAQIPFQEHAKIQFPLLLTCSCFRAVILRSAFIMASTLETREAMTSSFPASSGWIGTAPGTPFSKSSSTYNMGMKLSINVKESILRQLK